MLHSEFDARKKADWLEDRKIFDGLKSVLFIHMPLYEALKRDRQDAIQKHREA